MTQAALDFDAVTPPAGRRDRNKQAKLERIINAARELLAVKTIDEITTSEVATLADVANGTLFLYAKTKGELLLLVQNSHYEHAHDKGLVDSKVETDCLSALMSLLTPIVECNRAQVQNGRAYLQEVMFASGNNEHREFALQLMQQSETAVRNILAKFKSRSSDSAAEAAKAIMAIVFLTLSSPMNVALNLDQVLSEVRAQISEVI